jgi:hypothetical protein
MSSCFQDPRRVTGPNDSRDNPFGDLAHMLHDWLSDTATDADRASRRGTWTYRR